MAVAPRFSVIMPVYNGVKFIDAAIESVLAQSCRDFELLVCDDGSTDGTAERVASHARADARVRVLLSQGGRGPGARRNQALAEARAAWIAFLDADDLWPPQRLAWSAQAIEASPEAVILFGDYRRFTHKIEDAGPPVQEQKRFFDDRADYARDWVSLQDGVRMLRCRGERLLVYCCLHQCPISTQAVTLRRDVLTGSRIQFREDWWINEDFHVWMQMLECGPAVALREVLFFYRSNPDSLTSHSIRYLEGMAISHGEWRRRIDGRLSAAERRIYRDKVAGFLHSAAWEHSRAGRVAAAASAQWRALSVRCHARDLAELPRAVMRALWWRMRGAASPSAAP